MRTINQVEYVPRFVEDTISNNSLLEEKVVYISEKYNVAIHKCLCGCGGQTVMPLAHGDDFFKDKGWTMTKHEDGKVSFTPSVGNFQLPCNSHYIMTKNKANFV